MPLDVLYAVLVGNLVMLVIAAAAKLRQPAPFAASLRAAGVFSGRGSVFAASVIEIAVVGMAIFGARFGVATLALTDFAMTMFLIRLRRRGTGATCGCFGDRSAPVTSAHIAINAVFTATAAIVLVAPAPTNAANALRSVHATHSVANYLSQSSRGINGVLWLSTLAVSSYLWFTLMTHSFGLSAAMEAHRSRR